MNQVRTHDVLLDRTEDGKRLKLLSVVDEHTRECLAVELARSITAEAVIATLERIVAARGAPESIRSDNGPEFIAMAERQ
jgi:putative transposase